MAGRSRGVWWYAPALLALSAAAALLAWPLHGNGVAGTALRPEYSDFGWFAYAPVPEHPTTADLRTAGVEVPQDAVAARRRAAAGMAVTGLALLAVARIGRRRSAR